MHSALCILSRSLRLQPCFLGVKYAFILSRRYTLLLSRRQHGSSHKDFYPTTSQGKHTFNTSQNCYFTTYNINFKKCHVVALPWGFPNFTRGQLLWKSSPWRITKEDNFHFSSPLAPRHCSREPACELVPSHSLQFSCLYVFLMYILKTWWMNHRSYLS